jgi:hypothetical protein
MKIRTEYACMGIYVADSDELDPEECIRGYGKSPEEAIRDLGAKIEESGE